MIDVVIFMILIALSGFFSGAETAFFSLPDAQARLAAQRPGASRSARLLWSLKRTPEELLTTILIGNNIVNIFTASYATVVAARMFGDAALAAATGVTTLFILVCGEIVPKSLAYSNNERISLFAAPVLAVLRIVLFPAVRALTAFSAMLQRRVGGTSRGVTESEVRMMARMSVEHGEMDYREREMIENVFRFDNIPVRQVMTPRYKVVALNGTVPVEQIAYFVGQDAHSRYPVYVGDEDNIVGYIHVNALLRALKSDERSRPVKEFVVPLHSVPEDRNIDRVFRAMKRERAHLYAVHRANSPKEIIGIVTMEDLLEEIVGEIDDETDARSARAARKRRLS